MNKKPMVVITGLAVAAVAGIAGLTKDKWLAGAPPQVASTVAATAPEVTTPKVEAPAQPQVTAEAPPAQPAAAQPAPAVVAATPPAVEQPAPAGAPAAAPETGQTQVADAPAALPPAEQPAAVPEATVETPVAAPEVLQPTIVEAPATPPPAEQPADPPEQQTAAVQLEAPAPEQPAAAEAEVPETPASEQQSTVVQPEVAEPATPVAPETEAPAAVETVPAFDTVRVEKTGEAVIAGTAEAGSEVAVKLDGQTIGTTTANADGAFVVIPDAPLPAGSGALTIESTGKGDLQPVQSEQSVAVIIPAEAKDDALVAVVSPNEPTKILQKAQPEPPVEQPAAAPKAAAMAPKKVSIDAVDYDNTGNIIFSGQGQAGNTARVYVDNAHAGDAKIASDGRWSFAGTADVKSGQHSLRVDGIDAAGKVLNRVEVPFFREETSKVAAATPAEQDNTPEAAKTDSEVVAAGQDPAAATAVNPQITDAAPLPPKQGRVVIQPGNNLWRISRVLYGSGDKYTLLYKANKDQIRDPDMIFPGQIFMTPDVAPKVDTIDPKRREPLKPEENAASVQ